MLSFYSSTSIELIQISASCYNGLQLTNHVTSLILCMTIHSFRSRIIKTYRHPRPKQDGRTFSKDTPVISGPRINLDTSKKCIYQSKRQIRCDYNAFTSRYIRSNMNAGNIIMTSNIPTTMIMSVTCSSIEYKGYTLYVPQCISRINIVLVLHSKSGKLSQYRI